MPRTRPTVGTCGTVATLSSALVLSAAVLAQPQPTTTTNPLAGDPQAVDAGQNIYRGRCAVCHGIDAKGYRGSDLTTGDWVHGGSDAQIFRTIARGITGTEMPGNTNMSEEEIWMVVAYLRTLSEPGTAPVDKGDAVRGAEIFRAKTRGNCVQCHMVNGQGGRLGPNLSRIGASQSVAALEREIRRPSEVLPVGFETLTVVTDDGRRIRGVRKNEDTFSVQLMTVNEELRSFFKRNLKEVVPEKQSLMPTYGPERLTDEELTDLIRYLRTLRGAQ